jgi:hypothetical protein
MSLKQAMTATRREKQKQQVKRMTRGQCTLERQAKVSTRIDNLR